LFAWSLVFGEVNVTYDENEAAPQGMASIFKSTQKALELARLACQELFRNYLLLWINYGYYGNSFLKLLFVSCSSFPFILNHSYLDGQ